MKKLIETVATLIPFLQAYPYWIKLLVAFWIFLSAIILVALIFGRTKEEPSQSPITATEPVAKLPNQKETSSKTFKQQVTITGESESHVFQAGRDIVISSQPELKASISKATIQSILVEVRLTCKIKESAELPPDEVEFLPVGDAHAYIEGQAGKVRLSFQSPVRFRRVGSDRLVVSNRFVLDRGAELVSHPIEALKNYSTLSVPVVTVVWGKSLETIRLLEISIYINAFDPLYGSYEYNVPFQTGPRFSVPLEPFKNRLFSGK